MREFGWTIEYTLNLTFPVFLNLSNMLSRIRCDASIDENYKPYVSGKFGGKAAKDYFKTAGTFFLEERTTASVDKTEITPEIIDKANQKLRDLMKARHAALQKTIAPIS